jgi:2-polyprenyl-3-methyl-5-hydroxy-6-metoxy-1,4-benzoquinol methylase
MNCTICNGSNTEIKFIKNGYRILTCHECGHEFTDFKPSASDVLQIYSDDYFFKGGDGYDDYTLEKNMLIKRGEYYANKMKPFMSPGKLLDVGCAAGFILKGFANEGWDATGIEPNDFMVNYANREVGVNVYKGTIETVELKNQFDLVIMIQVIAHLYDVRSSMKRIYDLLKPGGHVLVETWNKDSISAKMFGKNWQEYSPPGTLNFFSKKTLNRLMNDNSFSLIEQGRPKKSIHSRHAKSIIRHKLGETKALKWMAGLTTLIPGNVILPYPAEDLFWALYQK